MIEIYEQFILLKKAEVNYDQRFILKVFRELAHLRKKLSDDVLALAINTAYPYDNETRSYLTKVIDPTGVCILIY